MSDEEVVAALRAAFAGDDDASAAWSQTAPEIKARCVAYVAAAKTDEARRARASEVAQLASSGPLHELGTGPAGVPEHLRHIGGLIFPPHHLP
jgi:hypothetical protein